MNTKEYQEKFIKIAHKTYPILNDNQIISNLIDTYNIKRFIIQIVCLVIIRKISKIK